MTEIQNWHSCQPFWKETVTASQIVKDESTGTAIRFLWFSYGQNANQPHTQTSVPGFGITTIAVSLDPDNYWAYVLGVVDRLTELTFPSTKEILYLQFSPGTFSKCFKTDSQEIKNQVIRLEDFSSDLDFHSRLITSPSRSEQVSVVCEVLGKSSKLYRYLCPQQLSRYVWQRIRESNGNIRACELADETGYSEQYLRTVLRQQIGLSPKQLSEQIRFQCALQDLLRNPAAYLTTISNKYMYADQAHFCREFKRFSGMCPTDFLNHYV